MPLTVFHGPFHPELEEAFLQRLSALRPGAGRPVGVVTSSRSLSARLQRRAAETMGAVFNVRFHTFHSLALEATESLPWGGRRLVADELLHDKLMDSLLPEGRGAPRSRGVAGAFRSTLRDLEEAGVDPLALREHLAPLFSAEEDGASLWPLLSLARAYAERLGRLGLVTLPALTRLATEAVEGTDPTPLDRYHEILYYGFYDLNGLQADFFAAVTKRRPCSLFFPYRADRSAFAYAKTFFDLKLFGSGAHVQALDPASCGSALGESLDNFFDPGRTVSTGTEPEALTLVSAATPRDEVWRAAKAMLALSEREADPVPFSAMALVARTLDPYRALVEEVFAENAIPYTMEGGGPLLRRPLARATLSLLTLARRDFPPTAVRDVALSPFGRGSRQESWKHLLSRLGPATGWSRWEAKLRPWTEKDLGAEREEDRGIVPGEPVPRAHTAALLELLERARGALTSPAEGRPWSRLARSCRELAGSVFALEDAPDGEAVLGILEEMESFDVLGPCRGWEEFLDTLEEKFSRARSGGEAPNPGVRVMGVMEARGEGFEAVFLVGLQEGIFPRRIHEDPLLRDATRARLHQPGGYWIFPKLAGYEEEKLLFTLTAASARKRLWVSHARADEDGKALSPSIYWRELCRAAGRDPEAGGVESLPRPPFAKWGALPRGLLTPRELSVLTVSSGGDPSPLWEDARPLAEARRRLAGLAGASSPGPHEGVTGPLAELTSRLERFGLSASALDGLAQCPFRFWMGRGLGLEDAPQAVDNGRLSPPLRGRLLHAVLEDFYRRGGDPALLASVTAEHFSLWPWEALGVYPLVAELEKEKMMSALDWFLRQDRAECSAGGWRPTEFERDLTAPAPFGLWRGRVDRVDISGDGTSRVVDYKSSRSGGLGAKVVKGDSYQAFVYMELAPESRGVVFKALEPGEKNILEYTREKWLTERLARTAQAEGLMDRARRGEFIIRPREGIGGHCAHCRFSDACRKAHAPTRRRAEHFWGLSEEEEP
jgi:ATP-dependent helicase/nuclease subunit B